MSDMKRYWPGMGGEMQEQSDGDYVLYEDHVAALKAASEEHRWAIARLTEEIERLDKGNGGFLEFADAQARQKSVC